MAIARGSSERSISVVVDNDDATTGVRVVHQMLFNTDQVIELFRLAWAALCAAEQVKRQQEWLKKNITIPARLRSRQLKSAADQRSLGEPEKLAQAELNEAKEPFQILWASDPPRKEYHLLNPVIVDRTSKPCGCRSVRGLPA